MTKTQTKGPADIDISGLFAQLEAKTRECRGWINLINRQKTRITDLEVELSNKDIEIEDLQAQLAAASAATETENR